MRTTVLDGSAAALVVDVIGQTERDLDAVEAPAAQVLRTLQFTRP